MIWLNRKSVTLRLTLLFAAVSSVVLLLLGLLIAALVEQHFEDLDRELLEGKLELAQQRLAQAGSKSALQALPAYLDTALVGHHGLILAIQGADGNLFYSSHSVEFPPSLGTATARPLRWSDTNGRQFRGMSRKTTTGIPGAGEMLVAVSTNLAHHEHFMHAFRVALWSVVGLAALASGLLGWLVARRGLAPLRDICRDAANITATRLDQRLPTEAIPLELAAVATTLNEMLGRLEESFRRLSDFSSDIAHELRTPVSNLLTQTQVTLSKTRTVETYQEVLASNAEEFERLSRMISDMLFLAKADNDLVIPLREDVDLRQEADRLTSFYEAMAEELDIQLIVTGAASARGDRLMLRRAMSNLLANACAHTPRGGSVTLRLTMKPAGMAMVAVENSGESIAAEHLPRLFDRFYRANPARQLSTEGVGLGLAITRSILRAHGGDAYVRSTNGVTVFELWLPTSDENRIPDTS